MTEPQIIEQNGEPAFAVIPIAEWRCIAERLEDLDDAAEIAAIRSDPTRRRVPGEVIRAILDGMSPARAWREHRGLTQKALAERAGLAAGYLSQIEAGRRQGTVGILSRLARVLEVDLDDLVDDAAASPESGRAHPG